MTVLEALTALSAYPIPAATIEAIGIEVGLDLGDELSNMPTRDIWRAKARIYLYLATAPNVSEGGVSISYSSADKNLFLSNARKFAELAGEDSLIPGPAYGYKGENI